MKMWMGGMGNARSKNRIRPNRMDRRVWKVTGLKPYPWTFWMKPLRKVEQYFVKPWWNPKHKERLVFGDSALFLK